MQPMLCLDRLFSVERIAVIGATETEGKVGYTVTRNLLNGEFKGKVYPVNPSREYVLGAKAYKNISSVPDQIDLAVIITEATRVPAALEECGRKGIKLAIVISAGFRESGEQELEASILAIARRYGMRMLGPNCLGLIIPSLGLNASFARNMPRSGGIAFYSSSGALVTTIIDRMIECDVGLDIIASVGNAADLSIGRFVEYSGQRKASKAIFIYGEDLGGGKSLADLISGARAAKKAAFMISPSDPTAARVARSHTGAMASDANMLRAVARRSGIVLVDRFHDFCHLANVLDKQPLPRGSRVAVVTNAGGAGVITVNALIPAGGALANLDPKTMGMLNKSLPPFWSKGNPVDVLGDARANRYGDAIAVLAEDPNVDVILVALTPQDMTQPFETAVVLADLANTLRQQGKMLVTSWMGAGLVQEGIIALKEAGIPNIPDPDTAAIVLGLIFKHLELQRLQDDNPKPLYGGLLFDRKESARQVIREARKDNRLVLRESEAKAVLSAFGIPISPTLVAQTADDAVQAAEQLGFPVVVKWDSGDHKTDRGGVKLNRRDPDSVRQAFAEIATSLGPDFVQATVQPMVSLPDSYELILGSSLDPRSGPTVCCGYGGSLVEVFRDVVVGLPPLTTVWAKDQLSQTKIWKALQGIRGRKGVDMDSLVQTLVRFSEMVAELNPEGVAEFDINPLLVSPSGVMALDARIVLLDKEAPIAPPVIRPYPSEYELDVDLKNGAHVKIRPMREEDRILVNNFLFRLSDESVSWRYGRTVSYSLRPQLAPHSVDYGRAIVLVAEYVSEAGTSIVGMAEVDRFCAVSQGCQMGCMPGAQGEFAVVVSDDWRHLGLGRRMVLHLRQISTIEGMRLVQGTVRNGNIPMCMLCTELGLPLKRTSDEIVATLLEAS